MRQKRLQPERQVDRPATGRNPAHPFGNHCVPNQRLAQPHDQYVDIGHCQIGPFDPRIARRQPLHQRQR